MLSYNRKFHTSILLFISIFLSCNSFTSQKNIIKDNTKKLDFQMDSIPNKYNKIKLNLANLPFGHVELAFEILLPQNTSIGISTGKSVRDIDVNFHILGFTRIFTGKKKGAGFFLEANTLYLNEKSSRTDNTKSYGIGGAIGLKSYHKGNFRSEFVVGLG